MAGRDYMKSKRGKSMVTIHGFSEMAEMLQQLEKKGVDEAATKLFDECSDIIKNAIDSYAADSLPPSLQSKTATFKVKKGNRYMFAYGWSDNDPETKVKVCYINYGTPRRSTKEGHDRGKVEPRYFLSNAKRSAAKKINARKKNMTKELFRGL